MAIQEITVSNIYILATEPTKKVKDRFWFDTTNNILKRYDGTTWKPISVSSDDIVVLSSGNKVSLTSYLNTQIADLSEGIDSKQDKLSYYTEVSGSTPSATISVANINLRGSVAEGNNTTASGNNSHAEGRGTKAEGNNSHAECYLTTASGSNSHAEGLNTTASGANSHAEGVNTKAQDTCSHAEGSSTTASSENQHAQGKYNIEDANDKYADIIGNGSSNTARSNAATVSWNGISWSQTDVRTGGTDQDNAIHSLSNKQNKLSTYKEGQGASSLDTTISSLTDEDGIYTGDIIISPADNAQHPGNITLSTGNSGSSGSITLTAGKSGSSATGAASLVLDKSSNGGNITLEAEEAGNITLKSLHGNLNLDVAKITGSAVDTTISSFSTDSHIPTSKAVYDATAALSESKQDKLTFYHEETSTNQLASIAGADSFSILSTNKGLILDGNNGGITIKNSNFNTGQAVISLEVNNWENNSDAILFSVDGDGIKMSDAFLIPQIKNKQNKLSYYSEVSGDNPSATISVKNIKLEGKVSEGTGTTASASASHAEGYSTTASGLYSHAEGSRTTASGVYSHTEGNNTTASGRGSHAEGVGTIASSERQHAQGKYNIEDANVKYADIIGNGSSENKRSNAATVSWTGISWSQTDVRAGGTDQDTATHSLAAKQNSTDNTLETIDKTIVGAINEINSIFNVNALPTPITDVKTITTTLENLITDTQYANKPGTILINPAITNVGTILVGEGITDINKAFPIYTDQPVTIAFKNINDFKVAGNIAGDKFNYIISFGYINTNIVSDNLTIATNNGVYTITPEGDADHATLKLSKIS